MSETLEQNKKIEELIQKIENKNFNIYYFTLDTKGNPTASIATIYEHVKLLTEIGYKAHILHEKNDYRLIGDENGHGLTDWLGSEYSSLSHVSIESGTLNIEPTDIIVIPEIFATIMDQLSKIKCKKIVLTQSHEYLLELLPIGKRWNVDYGFMDTICTSERQSNIIKNLFPSINTHIVPVSIPEYFKPSKKPKKPIVSILTRNQSDAMKIVKSFYLQYPLYKWLTFKELRGLNKEKFAQELSESCLAVWVDDVAGFGTFPLEAMECNTPVIGKIPYTVPEWMETTNENGEHSLKNNGIWTNTTTNIPDLISQFIKAFLEDSIPSELFDSMKESTQKYTVERQKESLKNVYESIDMKRVEEYNNIKAKLIEA